jgi:hypothetical protein
MEDISPSQPWLFNLRSSKQLVGLAIFSTTFTDGFLYGIVGASTLRRRIAVLTTRALS